MKAFVVSTTFVAVLIYAFIYAPVIAVAWLAVLGVFFAYGVGVEVGKQRLKDGDEDRR